MWWRTWGASLLGVLALGAMFTGHRLEGAIYLTGAIVTLALREARPTPSEEKTDG